MDERQTVPLSRSLMPGERLQDCTLTVVEGPDRGLSIKVEAGRMTIGADPRCDLVLSDPAVSTYHAEIALLPAGLRIRDLDSTNGIEFLGNRIADAILQPGSVVVLGGTTLAVSPPRAPSLEPFDDPRYGPLLGHGPRMQTVFAMLRRLETSEVTVLIEGETGSGKTLMAETLHSTSGRDGPLVTVDCGAISPNLIQSELFGHRKGAFTGATEDREGSIIAAHGGTILLDEIGDLPLRVQPALLRTIETQEVQAVGEPRPRRVDARVIATSSVELRRAVDQGSFRADLFYRISVAQIRVPPLRECPENILPLTEHFLVQIDGRTRSLSPGLTAMLESYRWPGNARQLRNAVERLLTGGSPFADDLDLVAGELDGKDPDFHRAKARLIEHFEIAYLEQLLVDHRGNLSSASRAAGLARNYLRALLKKHGIDPQRYRERSI